MDQRMKNELDHYLTTPPENDEPNELENAEEEGFCFYCGEPLDDGRCSALCLESLEEDGEEIEEDSIDIADDPLS